MFDSNKISLGQINIFLNKIKFSSKRTNYCIGIWSKIESVWFKSEIYLIWTKFYLFERYFVWIKKNLFNSNKSFFWIKESL